MHYLNFYFDDEDVSTPESAGMDDVTLQLADLMTATGVLGVFCLTGDKLRNLERRGRRDVLAALRRHCIGGHTNSGSRHPMLLEAIQNKTWDSAVAYVTGEQQLVQEEVRRLIGAEVTHFHCHAMVPDPVSVTVAGRLGKVNTVFNELSKSPSTFPAPTENYAEESDTWCGFFWWCNTLCMRVRHDSFSEHLMDLAWENIRAQRLDALLARFDRHPEFPVCGTLFMAHPMMLRARHYEQPARFFGTDVYSGINGWNLTPANFGRLGTPRLRTPEEMAHVYDNLRRCMAAVKAHPQVRFARTEEMARFYEYQPESITRERLLMHAEMVDQRKQFVTDDHFSAAEILVGWCDAVQNFEQCGKAPDAVRRTTCLGPKTMPVAAPEQLQLTWKELARAAGVVCAAVANEGAIPANVFCRDGRVGVGTLYEACARVYKEMQTGHAPATIELDRIFPRVPPLGVQWAKQMLGTEEIGLYDSDLSMEQVYRWIKLQGWTVKRAVYKGG